MVNHLGLVLHRILERGDLTLTIDTYDVELDFAGPPRVVGAVSFSYRIRKAGYPKNLPLAINDAAGTVQLHIWPYKEEKTPGFVLGGRSGSIHRVSMSTATIASCRRVAGTVLPPRAST